MNRAGGYRRPAGLDLERSWKDIDQVNAGQLGVIVQRLGPHIRDGSVTRSRLTGVLAALDATEEVAQRMEAALREAKIRILEDGVGKPAQGSAPEIPRVYAQPQDIDPEPRTSEEALEAARRRMEADRRLSRPEKVLLSAAEEVGLALIIRGPKGQPLDQGELHTLSGERRRAAETFIVHNLRLVQHIAQKSLASGMEFEDLYQGGMPGLFRAVEMFDPSAGNKFSTYATHWIRQSISRTVANESRLIRLPVHMFERLQKVWATRERLGITGQAPTAHELAKECGLGLRAVIECLRLGPPPASLDTPVGDDGTTTLGDLLDRESDRPEHIEVRGFFPEDVFGWLEALPDKQAQVLRMRHGLTADQEPMTLDEIGKQFGVTRERIRQIESKALAAVRENIGGVAPEAFSPNREDAGDAVTG